MLSSLMLCLLSLIIMKHPLTMGLILLLQTIFISFLTGFMFSNFWYSYILFLIMIGGLLILFIYMTSIASNEKFKINNKYIIIVIFFMVIFLTNFMDNFLSNLNYPFLEMSYKFNFKIMMMKYINFPYNLIMLMMILYLLLTLMMIVKITKFSKSSFRQKF